MPRALERLHYDALCRRGVYEQRVGLRVQGETVPLTKLFVCFAVTCCHALYESNIRGRSGGH